MDTIAINADETLNEERQEREKFKICGVTEEKTIITEGIVYLDDNLYADNCSTCVNSDIQSDLMV